MMAPYAPYCMAPFMIPDGGFMMRDGGSGDGAPPSGDAADAGTD
jgi:hypothetical protein